MCYITKQTKLSRDREIKTQALLGLTGSLSFTYALGYNVAVNVLNHKKKKKKKKIKYMYYDTRKQNLRRSW